jgi:hypothetical protein
MRRILIDLLIFFLATSACARQTSISPAFPPFEKWRAGVLSGDSAALSALYSKSPVPQTFGPDNKPISFQDEMTFWSSWKSKGLTNVAAQVTQQKDLAADVHTLVLQLTLTFTDGATVKKQFVAMAQTWFRYGDQWSLGVTRHSAATRLRQPLENKEIYPAGVDANREIAETLSTAADSHKRVLIVFGANWCFDCHVLDEAFQSPEIAPTLNKSFLVVHVDIGHMDKNVDLAEKYGVPLDRGVPALAVLDSHGELLFSQKGGEFEATRSMAPEDILAFLNKWKPPATE